MTIKISNIEIGNDLPLVLIAGPCQIESEQHALDTAGKILEVCRSLDIKLIYKSSFDKANRSSIGTKRGLGLDQGLSVLHKVKFEYDIRVLTDIH